MREPKLEDSENVSNLYKSSFPEHILVKWDVLSNPEKIREQFLLENKKWLIAESNKKIVGSSAVEVSEWNSAAEIERIVVAKDMRGNGIAKNMCKTLIHDVCEPLGVKYVQAYARGPEYGMQKALQNCGFRVAGVMPIFYVNHDGREIRENFVYMYRFLNGGKNELESYDNFIPTARRLQKIIEKQKGD